MKNLTKIIPTLILGLILGIVFNSMVYSPNTKVKDVIVFTDTLVLENQGEIDLYAVDGGRWLVISLDDLKYIVKKKRKTIIPNLESLFERFEIPEKVPVKPIFK